MKLIGISDLHIHGKSPENRLDTSYIHTCLKKFKFVLDYAIKKEIKYILIGGDFSDSPRMSHIIVALIIQLLVQYRDKVKIIVIPGQHDLYFHNVKNENIPLTVLHEGKFIKYIKTVQRICLSKKENIFLYTSPWETTTPKPKTNNEISILLTHQMVINTKLWEQQKKFTYARKLLKHFKFVISGDNHTTFVRQEGSRILLNTGSMMRKKTDQKNHFPCFGVINTQKKKVKLIDIPIQPILDVMDFSKKESQVQTTLNLDPFLEKLRQRQHITGIKYAENVKTGMHILDKATQKEVTNIMEKSV